MYRVLIIGCGQLGSRHLQAVSALPLVTDIDVVDPNPASLSLGQERLQQVVDQQPNVRVRWLAELAAAAPGGHLCIMATQATKRLALVKQAAAMGYRTFLLEKIVTQSAAEYRDLLALADAQELSIWVNCQERTYPFHQRVRTRIEPSEPVVFTSVGGNHGLACNGIHLADLFAFYTGAQEIQSAGAHIDPQLHTSKRGASVYDLSGSLHGYTTNGSQMTIVLAGDHRAPYQITIATRRARWIVDYASQWAWESREENNWTWAPIRFEGELRVSYTTRQFASDILTHRKCSLPTLAEAFTAHRFILNELQPHFNHLLGTELRYCPVT